jgi:hypothetical protein
MEMVRVGLRNGQFLLNRLNVLLKHSATSWKVAGLIPHSVTGIFHWHNPGPRFDLASNKMSTRAIYSLVKVTGKYGWQA